MTAKELKLAKIINRINLLRSRSNGMNLPIINKLERKRRAVLNSAD